MDVNEELKFFVKIHQKNWGGGGGRVGLGGQGGCGRRIEVFEKIQKINLGEGDSGGGGGGQVRVVVNEELKIL